MTRKRFVKLLMAEGYSRNSANNVADATIMCGYSYAEGYAHVTNLLPLIEAVAVRFGKAVQKFADSIDKCAKAMSEAASAAGKALYAAMSQA